MIDPLTTTDHFLYIHGQTLALMHLACILRYREASEK